MSPEMLQRLANCFLEVSIIVEHSRRHGPHVLVGQSLFLQCKSNNVQLLWWKILTYWLLALAWCG